MQSREGKQRPLLRIKRMEDHNQQLILSAYSNIKELLRHGDIDAPVTYKKLLFLDRQLRNRYRPPRDPLEHVWQFWQLQEIQDSLSRAKAWQKMDAPQNKQRNKEKVL